MNCCLCDEELELVNDNPYQPWNGGEVRLIFAFGSKFDGFPTADYQGVICDCCAEKFIDKLNRIKR